MARKLHSELYLQSLGMAAWNDVLRWIWRVYLGLEGKSTMMYEHCLPHMKVGNDCIFPIFAFWFSLCQNQGYRDKALEIKQKKKISRWNRVNLFTVSAGGNSEGRSQGCYRSWKSHFWSTPFLSTGIVPMTPYAFPDCYFHIC